MNPRTDFLFASPSFAEGMGRLLDFAGSLNQYNVSETPESADAKAIRQDFAMVGNDLKGALEQAQNSLDSNG